MPKLSFEEANVRSIYRNVVVAQIGHLHKITSTNSVTFYSQWRTETAQTLTATTPITIEAKGR